MIVLSTFGILSHEHWFRLLGNGSLKNVCALDSRRSNGLSFLHHVIVITKTIISRVDFIPLLHISRKPFVFYRQLRVLLPTSKILICLL